MRCKKCGYENEDNSVFCGNCGDDLSKQNFANWDSSHIGEMQYNSSKNNNPPKSSKTILMIVLIILLVLVAVLSTVIIMGAHNNKNNQLVAIATEEPLSVEQTTPEPQVIIVTSEPQTVEVSQPEIVSEEESIVGVMYVVKCNSFITLRKSPSTSADEIVKIPKGVTVGYISTANNGFYKVSYNGQRGYALASYLSTSPEQQQASPPKADYNSAPQQQNSVPSTEKLKIANCNEWVTLRSSANTTASALTTIPLGATVEFISTASNGFYKVRYNGAEGYVLSQYLQ